MALSKASQATLDALRRINSTSRQDRFTKDHEAPLDALSGYLLSSSEEALFRLRQLEAEGGIVRLRVSDDCSTVFYADAKEIRKQSDYRFRLEAAGYTNVNAWLTPEQAKLVRYWHKINVAGRRHSSVIRQEWMKAHLKELEEIDRRPEPDPPLPEIEDDGQRVLDL